MYKLILEKAKYHEEFECTFESDINDIAKSIPELLPDVAECGVFIFENEIQFQSQLSEKEIKNLLKDLFVHHFDSVRFSSLEFMNS